MRLGLIGPANGDTALLEQAADFLIDDVGAVAVVYLGIDDTLETLAKQHGTRVRTLMNEDTLRTAIDGDGRAVRNLIEAHRRARRLRLIEAIPYPPTRAIEMIDDRIVVFVHDKAVLDEEDVINSGLVVYGKSKELFFKRFGPRSFFTPGPLSDLTVGVVQHESDGRVIVSGYSLDGTSKIHEPLYGRSAKVMVSQ